MLYYYIICRFMIRSFGWLNFNTWNFFLTVRFLPNILFLYEIGLFIFAADFGMNLWLSYTWCSFSVIFCPIMGIYFKHFIGKYFITKSNYISIKSFRLSTQRLIQRMCRKLNFLCQWNVASFLGKRLIYKPFHAH